MTIKKIIVLLCLTIFSICYSQKKGNNVITLTYSPNISKITGNVFGFEHKKYFSNNIYGVLRFHHTDLKVKESYSSNNYPYDMRGKVNTNSLTYGLGFGYIINKKHGLFAQATVGLANTYEKRSNYSSVKTPSEIYTINNKNIDKTGLGATFSVGYDYHILKNTKIGVSYMNTNAPNRSRDLMNFRLSYIFE